MVRVSAFLFGNSKEGCIVYLIQIQFVEYHPFRFYSVGYNPVARNRVDEASARCEEAWDHDLKHSPNLSRAFPNMFTGVRCDKEKCHQCDAWYP